MNKHILTLSLLVLFFSCNKEQHLINKNIEKGISLNLAKLRNEQIKDVIYNLNFNIPSKKEEKIPAKLSLSLNITNIKNDLVLDFNEKTKHLKSIIVNNSTSSILHKNEHIIINKTLLKVGINKILIEFDAGELSLNRNEEYLYTLLVPDRANTLFPCFDQPDIKAIYNLTITAPKDWKVLCGAFEKNVIPKGDFTEHHFKQTDKMSTYLFSFVAGKFNEEIKNPGAFPMRFLYRETNPSKINESLNAIFSIHQNSLDFLEKYTNYNFPFQKMDFTTLPPFQYGGMEHTGAIQYRENLLFLDENATQTRKLRRAKLIAHETSHMWFGNLVTMRWFNDVWMKEVFANFMADKIMNPVFPEVNHDLNFMMSHYPSAYSEDRTKGTNPIRQNLDNLKNAGSLYGRIIYNKAPIMMRQLELLVGKDNFQKGIQEYITTYANSNADWNELVAIFDKNSSKNITQWSTIWVNSSGRPIISDAINYKDGKIDSFTVKQKAEDGSANIWEQSFSIGLVYPNETKILSCNLNKKSITIDEAIGLPKPLEIIYNYNGFGYGIFPFNNDAIFLIKNDIARGHSYINLFENMLSGKTPIKTAMYSFLAGLRSEKNELILNYITNSINTIFWKFLNENERIETGANLTKMITAELSKSNSKNIQKTLYNLLTKVAYQERGTAILYRLWSGQVSTKNFTLNESELTSLAMKLAIYKHPESDKILAKQLEKITNKDKKERFTWLLPSLSSDEKIRDDFMHSLKEAKNREKESWVTAALANIHHPLRQESATKHLKTCLELLEEIQLTGDIFFPKRWLTSSIGNYTSKKAHSIVQVFLNDNPTYNPILLKKLLMVVDTMDRAQQIKK